MEAQPSAIHPSSLAPKHPIRRPCSPCHTVTSVQLRNMSHMSHFCDIGHFSDTENLSQCDPIWPASTMSQMSHFSATKTRF